MFLAILTAVLLGASIHVARLTNRTWERVGEIMLLWVLAGYCGIPMLGVSFVSLHHSHMVADWLGFPAHNPFQTFLSVAYFGMALIATLSLRYRGAYLVGPALLWSVFFAGATFIHLGELHGHGGHGTASYGDVLAIVVTHGLISVLLIAALIASGVLRRARADG